MASRETTTFNYKETTITNYQAVSDVIFPASWIAIDKGRCLSLSAVHGDAIKCLVNSSICIYNNGTQCNKWLCNMEKSNVTVRLEADKIALLDQLAKADDRDRSYLIKVAIDQYLAYHQWRIEEIKKAVAEADAGDFASDEEMERLFAKWTQ